ncbi:MAG TPA: class I SAM-dependent methyltransferase [Anaerolineaceae bacterium]|nr:class I SAM-dependent methyltransferase [Anaerolineaceae bacterium]
MIGQYLSPAYPPLRRWILRTWGVADLHLRQQWQAVWPRLRRHARRSVRCLDAGCGAGLWTLELARRLPAWQLTGLDRDARALERGRGLGRRLGSRLGRRLGAPGIEWIASGFLAYHPAEPYDLVLSINSAHYMIAAGLGAELFERFCDWLRPGGELILVVPRRLAEIPAARCLPYSTANKQVTTRQLLDLAARPAFELCEQVPFVGRPGVWAQQIDLAAARHRLVHAAAYPALALLAAFDDLPGKSLLPSASPATPSAYWLLRLRKRTHPLESHHA